MKAAARAFAIGAVLLGAAYAAEVLTPASETGTEVRLAELVPEEFGEWTAEPQAPGAQVLLVPNAAEEPDAAQAAAYDDVLMRTYRRSDGARVMVALAYGSRQTQEIKIHRPELCYYAQGFDVRPLGPRTVRLPGRGAAESMALVTENRARVEIVTYWIRVGDRLVTDPWRLRAAIFRDGLRGRVPDGLLVRASSLTHSPALAERELALQHAFLSDLYRVLPHDARRFLAGGEVTL